ncbi:MAG TPA: hypothetical protein VH561_12255 [Micromonosporaceae bacterium]
MPNFDDSVDEQWWSIEVLDGESLSAAGWREAHGSNLVEAVLTNGGLDWNWAHRSWGLVLEVRFATEEAWEAFRALPAVQAALDAVPDPTHGLMVYRGRGGSAGAGQPRHPRPHLGAGAAPVPEEPEPVVVAGHAAAPTIPPQFALVG